MEVNEGVRFVLVGTEADKRLLNAIARHDGDSSMSATIRRLIRQEAQRRGIETVSQETGETSGQVSE